MGRGPDRAGESSWAGPRPEDARACHCMGRAGLGGGGCIMLSKARAGAASRTGGVYGPGGAGHARVGVYFGSGPRREARDRPL